MNPPKTLGLVHTSATLVPLFQKLCAEQLPGVEVFHIADDSLIRDVIARGALTPPTARRVAGHIASAESAGADFIMVTCSSIGPAVEAAVPFTGVPLLRVDQPMADQAVRAGSRIGVIATLPTTLAPTADLVERRARAAGAVVEIRSQLCEGAFEALMGGDAGRHDAMVADALRALAAEVDVIVLAQASMARVVDTLAEADKRAPILASPPIAVRRLRSFFLPDDATQSS
jgi:Asp/Glu/hydantoin racemase